MLCALSKLSLPSCKGQLQDPRARTGRVGNIEIEVTSKLPFRLLRKPKNSGGCPSREMLRPHFCRSHIVEQDWATFRVLALTMKRFSNAFVVIQI